MVPGSPSHRGCGTLRPAFSDAHHLDICGLRVEIARQRIKHLHLGVYPPDGRGRVAAPLAVDDEAVRLAVVQRLGWIRRQQARFAAQPRESRREMVSGESHQVFGQRHRPACIEYVVVHELAHLVERRQDDRFRALMDRVLPAWASLRAELSQGMLANDVWRE